MPRQARIKSSTGIYHCILRGVDKRDIFLDEQDRHKFMNVLKELKGKYEFEIYAYCLMNNHVHMLIKEKKTELCKIMHRLALKYSVYFNWKYDRVGHLFQNRYTSKPVETESYLLNVQRYIHQNPPYMETYKWSSYKDYTEGRNKLTDVNFILSMFGQSGQSALNEFKTFTCRKIVKNMISDFKDGEFVRNVPDEKVIEILSELIHINNILEIKKYNTKIRDGYLKKFLEVDGVQVGQLSRIMEIDKKTLREIKERK